MNAQVRPEAQVNPGECRARIAIALRDEDPDGRTIFSYRGEDALQMRHESDDQLAARAGHLLEILRARSIAIRAWRRDARRVSFRRSWPIESNFYVDDAGMMHAVRVGCSLRTIDATTEDARPIDVASSSEVSLATSSEDRIRLFLDLARRAISHEVDEHLLVDGRLAADPHDDADRESGTSDSSSAEAPGAEAPGDPSSYRTTAKLSISIERIGFEIEEDFGFGEILADDFIVQGKDETYQDLVDRARTILWVLRVRSQIPQATCGSGTSDPRARIEADAFDRIDAVIQDREVPTEIGDAAFFGLLALCGLRESIPSLALYATTRSWLIAGRDAMRLGRHAQAVNFLIDKLA
jgi:hypothetical protein